MRAVLVALSMLVCTSAAFAQQGPRSYDDTNKMPISPVVHPDRRVTISLLMPQAKEVLIVGGQMQATLKGAKPLTKDENGMWTITVGPLEPGFYNYGFAIDGGIRMADPANANVEERRWGHISFFEVPGDKPAFYDIKSVPHGNVRIQTYESKTLGTHRPLYVYTPPGYDEARGTKYPVLYLLHGSGQVEQLWTTVGRANTILDNLIAENKAKPMVIVMPYGHVPREISAKERTREGGNGTEGFEQDLLKDVIPFVEKNYRVLANRENRAIAGLSMGGSQSLAFGFAHLDVFSQIGAFSGSPRNFDTAVASLDAASVNNQLKLLWLGCGRDDTGAFNNLKKISAALTAKGIKHKFRESEWAHVWPVWRLNLHEFAQVIFQKGAPASTSQGR